MGILLFGLILVILLIYNLIFGSLFTAVSAIPKSTVNSSIVINEPTFSESIYERTSPNFSLNNTYFSISDPDSKTTTIYHTQSQLPQHIPEQFVNLYSTPDGNLLISNITNNVLYYLNVSANKVLSVEYKDNVNDFFDQPLFFFDEQRFTLDGIIFTIITDQLIVGPQISYYNEMFKGKFFFFKPEEHGVKTVYSNYFKADCQNSDILFKNTKESIEPSGRDKSYNYYLTEEDIPCILQQFPNVINNFPYAIFFANNMQAANNYLIIEEYPSTYSWDSLKKAISAPFITSPMFMNEYYYNQGEYYRQSKSVGISPQNPFDGLWQTSSLTTVNTYGSKVPINNQGFPRIEYQDNNVRNLYIDETTSLSHQEICIDKNIRINESCGKRYQHFELITSSQTSEFNRENAVFVGLDKNKIYFVTEKGLEVVTY